LPLARFQRCGTVRRVDPDRRERIVSTERRLERVKMEKAEFQHLSLEVSERIHRSVGPPRTAIGKPIFPVFVAELPTQCPTPLHADPNRAVTHVEPVGSPPVRVPGAAPTAASAWAGRRKADL
jgi:hypothetical protein